MMPCRRLIFRSPRAFSLVELVLVLGIMAMLAGIAVPRYGRATARYRADGAAKRVVADLQQARQRAKAASGPCTIAFDTATNKATLALPTIGGVAGKTTTTDFTLPIYRAAIQSVSFNGSTSISFDGYGMPSAGGSVVVASGSERRTVTLTAVTGTMTITSP